MNKNNLQNHSAPLLDTPSVHSPKVTSSSTAHPASSLPSLPEPPVPVKIYSNSETSKAQILLDNKNKSGIYMWKNNLNKKKDISALLKIYEKDSPNILILII